MDLAERISKLSPEQRKLLELKLRKRGMDTSRKPSIEPAEKKEYYPLSSAQKRFFMLQQMDSDKPAYNMPGRMRMEGIVNRDRFEEVLRKIIKRHEVLRTSFEIIAGEPFQKVHEDVEFAVEYYTLTSREAEPIVHGFVKPFDLTRPPLLRVSLIKLEEEEHIFLVDMHHIISDGSSLSLFIKEFMALYAGSRLPALTVQYKDFCQWQNQRFSSGELEKQEVYWLNRFSGPLPVLDMPTDYERPSVQSFDGDEVRFSLGKQLTLQLHAFMRQKGLTLFMGLTAIYSVLLSKYTGQEDIIIGSPRAGRDSRELEHIIGLFMETLALRSFPGGGKTCAGFFQEVKGVCLEAFENQAYPFGELLKRVVIENDLSRNPLFDALLIVQNIEMAVLEVEGLKFTSDAFDSHAAKLDINLVAFEEKDDIRFELKYCTALFKAGTMERFSRHFVNLIKTVVNNPGVPLALLEIMSAEEKRQVLEVFNRVDEGTPATAVLSRQKPVHELFAEQAEKTPDRIAIHRTYRTYMTYKELNRRSNQLASLLIEKGVKSNSIVGIMVQPSVDMFIGILGILKAGGAYLPIEPGYPEERIGYMLKDSGVRILLSEVSEVSEDVEVIDLIKIIGPIGPIGPMTNDFPTQTTHPAHLSYIIYTSGSTGKPKGVMVEHRNLTAYLHAFFCEFDINAADTVIQLASYCFDVFIEEVFPVLLRGGKLLIPDASERKDMDILSRLIAKYQVNVVDCTPLVLNEFNKLDAGSLSSVHTFINGGDVLKEEYVSNLLKIGKVYNTYGPTESTVCATYYRYPGKKRSRIPIGKPVANTKVYILDRNSRVQPVGVAGELCVSGAGVTRGYLNNPELTSEKFFSSSLLSFSASQLLSFSLYRTGDLARWLPDGNIEFLGRKDEQVKIRGFRIELGEIEARLAAHEEIKEAVVLDIQDESGNKYLCAYILPAERKEDNPFNVPDLRVYLSEQLPDYMIPSQFIEIDEIPLTPNGKIEKKSLLALEGGLGIGVEYVAPGTDTQEKLAAIWQETLGIEKIGIHDNFFDLGGDSILVNRTIAGIRGDLKSGVSLRTFFEHPTIAALSRIIDSGKTEKELPPIERVPRDGHIPLSFSQERLWFLQQLDGESVSYHVPRRIRIRGQLDVRMFERTYSEIIRRHEILRTEFPAVDGRPVQRILEPFPLKIPVFDLSSYEGKEQEQRVSEIVTQEGRHGFDFEREPLIRITLLKLREDEHVLISAEHHLVHDGWTQGVILKEFIAIYTAFSEGKPSPLPELPIQYADYAVWQRRYMQGERLNGHLGYWKRKLAGLSPLLELPGDRPRPPVISGRGAIIRDRLPEDFSTRLRAFSKAHDVTVFMTMLAVFNLLLFRYVNTEIGDICVGTGIANRRLKEIEGMLGMVINTLPLRTGISGDLSFLELLQRVKTTCLEAYEHEDTPFEKIVEHLQPERSLSYTPLFQVLFSFMDTPTQLLRLPGLELTPEDAHNRSSKFDLNIVVIVPPEEEGKELHIEWEYNTDIFEPGTAERMLAHYKRLLEGILKHAAEPIAVLPMLEEPEIRQLLVEWNDTSVDYPGDKTIHRLFEEQVEKAPEHIAMVGVLQPSNHRTYRTYMTYKKLNEKSNQLAYLLRKRGIGPDDIVGIMLERSVEMVVGVLGILKANGAYLPISPGYPEERKQYMLAESNARFLLSKVGEVSEEIPTQPTHLTHPTQLCYIMYTSGSTGTPKGVMVTHKNVVRLVKHSNFVALRGNDSILQTGPLEFDASTFEIWGALLNGLKLYQVPRETILTPELLKETIQKNHITTMWMTSPLFNQMVDADIEIFQGLKNLLVGGDVLSPAHINRVRHLFPGLTVINGYGPTENTTFSTTHRIDKDYKENIPIGKPINNSTATILHNYHQPVPIGIPGELYVGGDGLSRGYLNNPELTNSKFLFSPLRLSASQLLSFSLYRTGDLARWLPDGNIEFLGRKDHQVKIRGYRIEPGEIENHLLRIDFIREAVVFDWKNRTGEKYLCAYIVAKSPMVEPGELKEILSKHLPDHMVPAYFVQMEEIPLTPNGKVDRKALPGPETVDNSATYAAPRNRVEERLAEIWSRVLAVDKKRIGIDSDFFHLGGHSLKATLLISRLHKAFHTKIPLAELFRTPTIRELAETIGKQKRDTFVPIPAAENREYYELSPAQTRLYILHQMEPASTGYNIPYMVRLEGRLDREELDITFRKLINRHESLRTFFQVVNQQPVQRIHKDVVFELEFHAPCSMPHARFVRPFDLSRAPLLRVGLAKLKEQEYLLMLDMHHIITDGNSQVLLVKEFISLYAGEALEPLRIQYRDYVLWLKSEAEKERVTMQETFWLKEFQGEIPVLNLPTDFPRPAVQCFEGSRITFSLCQKETMGVKNLASTRNVTLYMVLLAIFNVVLSKLSGQEDIVVGTPAAGRRHTQLDHMIGMFVNTLCLRNAPPGEMVFKDFLEEVRKRTLAAFEHQEYPFEYLVERLSITRDAGRNPLFDVMFALQNIENPNMEIPGLKVKPFEYEIKISKFDMTWMGTETEGQLVFTCEYSTKLFKKMTIQRFAGYFKNAVSFLWENPEVTLAEVEILSKDEKKQILFDFNRTAAAYPKNKTIQELFETQVEQTPDNIALIGSSIAITYKELNKKSHQLAYYLHRQGVRENELVGLLVNRSVEMIIGILGILKIGCAYVPLNPKAPATRLKYILEECRARFLVSEKSDLSEVSGDIEVIGLTEIGPIGPIENRLPAHLCYVIFTSGSTGKPKGVPITHANLCPLLHWGYRQLGLGSKDRFIQNLSYYFDWSVWEIVMALTTGAVLYMVSEDLLLNPEACVAFMNRNAVTVLHVTPTQYQYFLKASEKPRTLKYLFIGAEKLSRELVEQSFQSVNEDCRVFNMYGPTECTIISAVLEIERSEVKRYESLSSIPIGVPVANTNLLVLDQYLNLCPVNVPGELYIAGDGVNRGYLNNPELTAEKYRSYRSYRSYTLYRTGDLVRWFPDDLPAGGSAVIEFLGRVDFQVKIRGFRIEPGEIESELLKYDLITEAVVINRYTEKGENYLCAYIVSKADIEVSELRQYLSRNLPDYMIPAYFMQIDYIPLNPNGKVDRGALPRPEVQADETYTAPANQIEKELTAIWADVLSIEKDKISMDADFFELGGHSLKATVLISEIHKKLNAAIPLAEIFRAPTIRKMAAAVSQSGKQDFGDLEKIEEKEFYQLSFNQQRLLIIHQLDPRSPAFHIPGTIILNHPVEKQVVQKTLRRLTERHESLRTAFKTVNDQPVQFIVKEADIPLRFIDISSLDKPKQQERKEQIYGEEAETPFDLSRVPLFRVLLLKLADHHYELFFNVHHIISDGWSLEVLRKEFSFFYEGYRAGKEADLEPLPFRYKDFARWQTRQLEDRELREKSHGFWKKSLETGVPVQQLPADFTGENSMKGAGYRCMIHQDLKDRLKQVAKQNNTTLFMVTFSLFLWLLYRFSNQEQVVCSIIDSGREHASLRRMIGFFVNSVLFKTSVDAEEPFADFLQRINRERLEIFKHKNYPLELVFDDLSMRPPEVSVSFNMLNILETAAALELTPFEPFHLPRAQDVKFEIEPYVTEYKNGINIYWAYKKSRFSPENIGFMAAEYIKLMDYFGKNTAATIKDYRHSGKKRRFKKSKP